jgi:hypothetical protein
MRVGIIHGDLHYFNVMLKETKQRTLTFQNGTIKVPLFGVRPWIMDFESSIITEKPINARQWNKFIWDLKRFFHMCQGINGLELNFDSFRGIDRYLSDCDDNFGVGMVGRRSWTRW